MTPTCPTCGGTREEPGYPGPDSPLLACNDPFHPGWRSARGALPPDPGGLSPEERIRRLRDGSDDLGPRAADVRAAERIVRGHHRV